MAGKWVHKVRNHNKAKRQAWWCPYFSANSSATLRTPPSPPKHMFLRGTFCLSIVQRLRLRSLLPSGCPVAPPCSCFLLFLLVAASLSMPLPRRRIRLLFASSSSAFSQDHPFLPFLVLLLWVRPCISREMHTVQPSSFLSLRLEAQSLQDLDGVNGPLTALPRFRRSPRLGGAHE